MADLFRRILVPHDFSAAADDALRVAVGLARRHRGRITVLHVVPPYPVVALPAPTTSLVTDAQILAAARQNLDALVRRLVRGRSPRVRALVVPGDPYHRIVEASAKATSVVMATEGRTGLSHLLIGSVTEKVVRHSPRPVLTLRPRTTARAKRRRRRP